MKSEVTIKEIKEAHERIRPHVHQTPVLTCNTLDEICNANLFFKCENFQKIGAFKIRGATNAVFQINEQKAKKGVATHSSGNHGAALALAARLRGIKSYVIMPENSPEVKKKAVAGYGAKIIFCRPTLKDREETLSHVVNDTGAVFIHPYNDSMVISGQGTASLELCEKIHNLDTVIAPVGGGGLLSGTAIAVTSISPKTKVIGAEPERADDAYRSFHSGAIVPVNKPDTIADGLRTSLGDITFPIIKKYVKDIFTVSEDEILFAMRLIWERMKIVVEPSAAVALSALLRKERGLSGERIGIILSGGNIDLENIHQIMNV